MATAHASECPKSFAVCKWQCGKRFLKPYREVVLQEHEQNCDHRQVQCPWGCGQLMRFLELPLCTEHTLECPNGKVKCRYKCGHFQLQPFDGKAMQQHEAACLKRPYRMCLHGCGHKEYVLVGDDGKANMKEAMMRHETEVCQYRPVRCEYCQEELLWCRLAEHQQLVACPCNCGHRDRACVMGLHTAVCEYEPWACQNQCGNVLSEEDKAAGRFCCDVAATAALVEECLTCGKSVTEIHFSGVACCPNPVRSGRRPSNSLAKPDVDVVLASGRTITIRSEYRKQGISQGNGAEGTGGVDDIEPTGPNEARRSELWSSSVAGPVAEGNLGGASVEMHMGAAGMRRSSIAGSESGGSGGWQRKWSGQVGGLGR